MKFFVDEDIRKAETLPAAFYNSSEVFDKIKENIFTKSWQWIGDASMFDGHVNLYPINFLDHFIHEPLLLTKDENGAISCISNVCTHRANVMIHHPQKARKVICDYHGRRFDLNGSFEWMPEFDQALDFPRSCDNLHNFHFKNWKGQFFAALQPAWSMQEITEVMDERLGFLPIDQFKKSLVQSKDYIVNAHWALYCDNYLEGFHIPFVHPALNEALDYGDYTTEVYDKVVLQIGYAKTEKDCFDLPEGHPDHGRNVAAYYYWVFPNMMFNFYPWGLSVNVVKPISKDRTKVSFISYVHDASKLDEGAGKDVDRTEREDEFVVENVHQGLRSRFYQTGRFSPKREKGVHAFHRLLANHLQ